VLVWVIKDSLAYRLHVFATEAEARAATA